MSARLIKRTAVAFGSLCLALPGFCESRMRRYYGDDGRGPAWKDPIGEAIRLAMIERFYDDRTSTEERERLKRLRMAGENGVDWARHYARKEFPDENAELVPMWRWLEELLAGGTVARVHQVAASSGRETAYYARRFPAASFVGSDMDPDVVAEAGSIWSDVGNLRFVTLDLLDVDNFAGRIDADVVFTSGGLEYLDEPSLGRFFAAAAPLATTICLCEPVRADFPAAEAPRSTRKGNFSWNHNYAARLRAAGYEVAREEAISLPAFPWAKTVSVMATRR